MEEEKKKKKLTPEEEFCLDAYLVNSDVDMAYRLSRNRKNPPEATEFNLHRLALRWLRSDLCQSYIKGRKAAIFAKKDKADTVGEFRTKEAVISALEAELPILRGKDRLDALMKIADLQQMKKEETKTEEDKVHFYLPLTCHHCELYINRKNQKDTQNPGTP